jgi:hypothetical protein
VPNDQLRAIANGLQGTSGYNEGVSLDVVQTIARQAGLRTDGLDIGNGKYRQWSMADIIREVRSGYPIVTLVHFSTLPAHAGSSSTSDHYIVVVGLTSGGFVINDPASLDGSGFRQVLSPDDLLAAWRASNIPQQGIAFLPPKGTNGIRSIGSMAALKVNATSTLSPSVQIDASVPPPEQPIEPVVATETGVSATPTGPVDSSWTRRVGAWQHAAPPATIGPSTARKGDSTTLVLADHASGDTPILPTVAVFALVGAIALAIVKAPRMDDSP